MNDVELHYYDIYGFVHGTLESAKSIVETALDITLSAHESSFRGGEYYALGDIGQEHFLLQRNWDIIDKEAIEGRFSHIPVLLYVNETTRPEQIAKLLTISDARFRLLNRDKI